MCLYKINAISIQKIDGTNASESQFNGKLQFMVNVHLTERHPYPRTTGMPDTQATPNT